MELTPNEMIRYSRQIRMAEIGSEGQMKLKKARVFLAGLGGLGSVLAYYLAAAGVGHLRIVDKDTVSLDNLNRQILHFTKDIGRAKTVSAREKLEALNPECHIEVIQDEIDERSGELLVDGSDLIVDGMDNFRTRRILNRVAVKKRIPFIVGGVDGLSGMVFTVIPGVAPCFECIFPGVDEEREVAVLGATAGVVASLQVMEAVKVVLGLGKTLSGRLLVFQGRDMTFREITIERNPKCVVCGAVEGNQ